ncbi:MAG: SDR family oxidoreductase [Candidatus Cloacimonetes bacterium]|nr:SDR family oxidoreductase [Candidatus Cloacimonadota bacterium]
MLTDKVIVLAGACGLIGKAISEHILQSGGTLVLADINNEGLQEFSKVLALKFGEERLASFVLDINSDLSLKTCIADVCTKFKKIDAFVNCSYPRNENYGRKFFDVEYDDFCKNLNLNLGGYFLSSQKFLEFFLDQGHGNIINFSSIYGVVAPKFEIYSGTPMTVPVEYAAIKSALIHLTAYMAKMAKSKKVRVNCISPGGILDGQASSFLNNYGAECIQKGMLDPQDIQGTVLFLLSDMSKYINGQNIIVDDGFVL